MKGRIVRAIEAYRDGALGGRQRLRVEQILQRDAEAVRHLREAEALGRSIRGAWREGPPAPPPERFLAAIGSELHRIDAERARAGRARSAARWLSRSWRPLPLGAGLAAAAAVVLALGGLWLGEEPHGPASVGIDPGQQILLSAEATPPLPVLDIAPLGIEDPSLGLGVLRATTVSGPQPFGSQSAIYDLYQGDASVLIFDGVDEPLMIFAIPDDPNDLSRAPAPNLGWS